MNIRRSSIHTGLSPNHSGRAWKQSCMPGVSITAQQFRSKKKKLLLFKSLTALSDQTKQKSASALFQIVQHNSETVEPAPPVIHPQGHCHKDECHDNNHCQNNHPDHDPELVVLLLLMRFLFLPEIFHNYILIINDRFQNRSCHLPFLLKSRIPPGSRRLYYPCGRGRQGR